MGLRCSATRGLPFRNGRIRQSALRPEAARDYVRTDSGRIADGRPTRQGSAGEPQFGVGGKAGGTGVGPADAKRVFLSPAIAHCFHAGAGIGAGSVLIVRPCEENTRLWAHRPFGLLG